MSEQNNTQNQTPVSVETSSGLWWKIPLGLAATAGIAFGIYKLVNQGVIEDVVEKVTDAFSNKE